MARHDALHHAIDRWRSKGLIDDGLAGRLHAEASEAGRRTERRTAQYALSVAGGVVLLVSAGVLGDWLWPQLGPDARSFTLAVAGVLVHGIGYSFQSRRRWLPASYALQTAGLLILLGALMYSEVERVDASPGGIVAGVVALAVALVSAPMAFGRGQVMPAVHVAAVPAFGYVFLDRAFGLDPDRIVWILDAVLATMLAVLLFALGRLGDRDAIDARLHAFVAAVYAALALLLWTTLGPLALEENAAWAVDVWWAVVVGLNLWALHRGPEHLRRGWLEVHLAVGVLLTIPLTFWTCLGALELQSGPTAVALGGLGATAIAYGLVREAGAVLGAGAFVVVVAAWYFGVEQGGVLGAAAALAFTAALLIWLSVRVGRVGDEDDRASGPAEP